MSPTLTRTYLFNVRATDSDGNSDLTHVVLFVEGTPDPDQLVALQPMDCTGMLVSPSNDTEMPDVYGSDGLNANFQLHWSNPSHGQLEYDAYYPWYSERCTYIPDPNYRGLDSVDYYWTYEMLNDTGQPIGPAQTNVGHVVLQDGPWVGLTTENLDNSSDNSSLAVGTTSHVTLTLDNIRDNSVATAERWYLQYDPSVIRVYDSNGNEILPGEAWDDNLEWSGHSDVELVKDQWQTQLTVVTVGPGTTSLSATSVLWNNLTNDAGMQPPNWGSDSTSTLNYAVSGCSCSSNCGCSPDNPDGDLLHGNLTSQPGSDSTQGLILPTYNSQGDSQPIIAMNYTFSSDETVPQCLEVSLSGFGSSQPVYYSTAGYNPGDTVRLAIQTDAASLATGPYSYTLTVTEYRNSVATSSRTTAGPMTSSTAPTASSASTGGLAIWTRSCLAPAA